MFGHKQCISFLILVLLASFSPVLVKMLTRLVFDLSLYKMISKVESFQNKKKIQLLDILIRLVESKLSLSSPLMGTPTLLLNQ